MTDSYKFEVPPEMAALLTQVLPGLSINCIIFRFRANRLEFVASRLRGNDLWFVPWGFIYRDEDIDTAAGRVLFDDTKIEGLRQRQFGAFGAANRIFGNIPKEVEDDIANNKFVSERVSQRIITIAYYSILGQESVEMSPGIFFEEVAWIGVNDPINMGMDHSDILAAARTKLRSELRSQPVLQSFLPDTFTMPDLQALHEAILDRPIDRGNFRRRILRKKFLVEVGVSQAKTGRRPRKLYRFDESCYRDSLTEEMKLGF